jgi:hypothetical protein
MTMLDAVRPLFDHRITVDRSTPELGATPPLVDFIAWVWAGKPAAKW